MKQSVSIKFDSVLLISIALLLLLVGVGNHQIAAAASLQNHDLAPFEAADLSAYRLNSSAQYYAMHQVWPAQDLTTLSAASISAFRWEAMAKFYLGSQAKDLTIRNAADLSAYRWEEMAKFYLSHQVWSSAEMNILNKSDVTEYRFFMIEPGFWTRLVSLDN